MIEQEKKHVRRVFTFNKEMERDMEDIRFHFRQNYKIEPSNNKIMNTLLKTFKATKIERLPRSKNELRIKL